MLNARPTTRDLPHTGSTEASQINTGFPFLEVARGPRLSCDNRPRLFEPVTNGLTSSLIRCENAGRETRSRSEKQATYDEIRGMVYSYPGLCPYDSGQGMGREIGRGSWASGGLTAEHGKFEARSRGRSSVITTIIYANATPTWTTCQNLSPSSRRASSTESPGTDEKPTKRRLADVGRGPTPQAHFPDQNPTSWRAATMRGNPM